MTAVRGHDRRDDGRDGGLAASVLREVGWIAAARRDDANGAVAAESGVFSRVGPSEGPALARVARSLCVEARSSGRPVAAAAAAVILAFFATTLLHDAAFRGSLPTSMRSGGAVIGPAADGSGPRGVDAMNRNQILAAVASAGISAAGAMAQDAVQWRVEDGGNGHWYQGVFVSTSGVTWSAARALALTRGADLVSLNTLQERQWVFANVASNPALWSVRLGPWIGGFQPDGSSEPGGEWKWVDGTPLYDDFYWDGAHPDGNNNCGGPANRMCYWGNYTAGVSDLFADCADDDWFTCWNIDFGPHLSCVIEWSADCNGDGVVDYGQCRDGSLPDFNGNNIPDCCEGAIVAWGDNSLGQSTPPILRTQVAAITAGYDHSACLLADGTVLAWGYNAFGQCDVPGDLNQVVSVSAGDRFVLALQSNGMVRAWGFNGYGQCDVPEDLPPVVQISAGGNHGMAQLKDGSLRCWGNNDSGQSTVPLDLGSVTTFEGGVYHSVAVTSSASVRCWGLNDFGQCSPPAGLASAVAVSGGDRHTVALLADGSVRCWGQNSFGQCSPPAGMPPLSAISASDRYTLGLTTAGVVVRWGQVHGQLPGQDTVCTMIAAGAYHGFAVLPASICGTPCLADIDGNGEVNGIDLAIILDKWGTDGGKDYPNADIDGDGTVAGPDLSQVLSGWGPCQ